MQVLHKSNTRGFADHGWLKSYHTFSFANYHHPERVHFGMLRVLNDDEVKGGMGFGTHPHDNMEIISIPLKGAIAHKDSMGTSSTIKAGEVQIMSAGSGVTHSEFNPSKDETVNFLQIWIFPKERDIKPRYDQKTFHPKDRKNKFQTIVAPTTDSSSLWINQDAFLSLATLEKGSAINYKMNKAGNGIYFFILEGDVTIAGNALEKRDGLGITDENEIAVKAKTNAEVLAIEVPMN